MAEILTFAPEPVSMPTDWERVQLNRARAREVHRQLGRAVGGFNFALFMRDFAAPLVEEYNTDAKRLGLPSASKDWFRVLRTADGGALAPKDFFVKHRARIQPRLFPGDQAKAGKAYDLLLAKLSKLPKITSGPISGELAHEFGHVRTFEASPEVASSVYGPKGEGKEKRPPVENAVNEALAIWQGFRQAWKAWSRFGMPHKAWGAWFGFPTYTHNMKENQLAKVLKRLKALESKYPGVEDQARKALFEYDKYVEPVMYNVPGADWTAAEREALKRWLKARGGAYRGTMPEDESGRLKHLRRQPFVMAPQAPGGTAVASALPPLSKRAMIPLSSREGET